jgi:uncharacterized protein (TIGR01777 family)
VAGIGAADPRPGVLVSASAVGYYGPRGDEEIDESEPAGQDFLATVCQGWETAAQEATAHGARVALVRTGVVLDAGGGALAKMLPPFKLGIGGPVAGGKQWMPWIHVDDVVDIYLAALDGAEWSGPVNASAPAPATNAEFSKALGRALHRPAALPFPSVAVRSVLGEMGAELLLSGQHVLPAALETNGFDFRCRTLAAGLESALADE